MLGRVFLGRYQTLRLLGEGGMGLVYLARQLDLGRQVVVKVMHDHLLADPKFSERFQRETLVMARFQHPYAVTLYDASLNDPQGPCIVMEYIRGVTLDALMANNRGHLSPARAGRLLSQLCEVLQAAHQQKIIHRDLKPANLMVVEPDTPYEKIKVMDFGLVKLLDQSGAPAHGSGMDFAVGTPAYICPEQVKGEPLDHRSDLYSVGVILYEMLTGRIPYGVISTMNLLLAHATEEPHAMSQDEGGITIPPAIEEVVLSCLAKNPARRPASAMELSERYQAALNAEMQSAQANTVSDLEDILPERANEVPVTNPHAVTYRLEAWMPEAIAIHKLRGFIHDVGGDVLENGPGQVRVRLGGPGSPYQLPPRGFRWLGLARNTGVLQMDLQMIPIDIRRQNHLGITVELRSLDGHSAFDASWRAYTAQIFCDLRAYLMGRSEPLPEYTSA
jgi:serine/threonine-protein kinase